jgi:hypothetical protein
VWWGHPPPPPPFPLYRQVPAWNTAALLDYVFSDDRRSIWDNNGGRDYHTLLKNPASGGWVFLLCMWVGGGGLEGGHGGRESAARGQLAGWGPAFNIRWRWAASHRSRDSSADSVIKHAFRRLHHQRSSASR